MNMFDRALAAIAPRMALERARARAALAAVNAGTRAYEGGRISRRMPNSAPKSSANRELYGAGLGELRARARDMVRNNPYCARALDVWASNVVGGGIVPASRTGDQATDARVNELWKRFVDECDAENQMDFYGLQTLAARAAFEGGDTLARLRTRRAGDGFVVPLQIQLLESDYLDSLQHGPVGTFRRVLGIEFDSLGRRSNYFLFSEHPGDWGQFQLSGFTSQAVPAADVVHLYRKARIGQVRGVSAFAPVMLKATDLRDLEEAVVIKARIEACFAGFITSEEGDGGAIGVGKKDADGNDTQEFQPGMIRHLRPGESIDFANPTSSTSFDPVMTQALMGIAVGLGLTHDELTGDFRQANYSSMKAGRIVSRRLIEQTQYQMMVPMFCAPIRKRWLELALLTGQLSGQVSDYPCEWIAPAHEALDPIKDLTGDIMAVRSGRMTMKQFISSWGNDYESHMAELAAGNKVIDDLGLTLDIDPRKVSQAGLVQQVAGIAAADAAAAKP